jgi:hypothetical protein
VIAHPGRVYWALVRRFAKEIKAAVGRWSPSFDLAMVSAPVVWNFVQGVLIKPHAVLAEAGVTPIEKQRREARQAGRREPKNHRHLLGGWCRTVSSGVGPAGLAVHVGSGAR